MQIMSYLLLVVQGAAQEALENYSKTLSAEYNSRVCQKLVRKFSRSSCSNVCKV